MKKNRPRKFDSEFRKIYKTNFSIYAISWFFLLIIGNIDNFLRGEGFDVYSLLNLISLVLFLIVLPLYSKKTKYRKNIYLSEDFHIGLLLLSFGIFGLIFVDYIWGGVTFILTLGLVVLILANFEREVYNWGVKKYNLKKKDELMLLPCPDCKTINAFTKNKDEDATKEDVVCKECELDLRKEYEI